MPPKIEKRSTLLILNSSTEMLECGIPWIWHSSLQCPLKASLSAWQPSTWNRERWGPANPLQLRISVEVWALPPLRPLGTSPPVDADQDKERFWSPVAREECQSCTRRKPWTEARLLTALGPDILGCRQVRSQVLCHWRTNWPNNQSRPIYKLRR